MNTVQKIAKNTGVLLVSQIAAINCIDRKIYKDNDLSRHNMNKNIVIAQNLVDFEQLNAKCRMQIEKYKIQNRGGKD